MNRHLGTFQLLGGGTLCVALLAVALRATDSRVDPVARPSAPAAAEGAIERPPQPLVEAARPEVAQGRAPETESAVRRGFYAAPSGTLLRFDVELHQDSLLSMTGDQPSRTECALELKTRAQLRVLARRGDECLASLEYVEPHVGLRADGARTDAEACSDIERQLAQPVHVRIREDGTASLWSFPADMTPWVRQMERAFLAQIRFVVPADAAEEWSTKERDATGAYEVAYRRAGEGSTVEVQRRRSRCTPSGSDPSVVPETRIDDRSRARFDPAIGWLVEATCDERMVVEIPAANVRVETSTSTRWRMSESRREAAASAELAAWNLEWNDDLGTADLARSAEEEQRRRDEGSIAGMTLENSLYDLEEVVRTSGLQSRELFEARELLRCYLRQHPGELQRFAGYVSDGSLGEDATGVALSALGSIGTPAGQKFLAEVATDAARTEKVRMLAMFALFQVSAPDADAESVIATQWLDPDASMDLRSTALLLLGTYARGSAERSEALLAYEPRAEADGMLDRYVSALGNAHLYTQVEPYLRHDDPLVRQRAAEALARR